MMAAFDSRTDVSFGPFKRDALFHETLSPAILAGLDPSSSELDPLRDAWPWLVPLHVGFDLVHLGQEIGDRPGALR